MSPVRGCSASELEHLRQTVEMVGERAEAGRFVFGAVGDHRVELEDALMKPKRALDQSAERFRQLA